MKKSVLGKLPLIRFSPVLRLDNVTDVNCLSYVYKAAIRIIDGRQVLEVDYYSIAKKCILFRTFFTKDNYINQILWPQPKWSSGMYDNFNRINVRDEHGKRYEFKTVYDHNATATDGRTARLVERFFKAKIKLHDAKPVKLMMYFQESVKAHQLHLRHQKIKDRIKGNFVTLDKIPRNMGNWVHQYPLSDSQYVFYKRKGRKINGYCSACRHEVILDEARHNAQGICPKCNHSVTLKAEGRSKRVYDRFVFNYIQKSVSRGIMIRIFEGIRSFRDGFDKPEIRFWEMRRYIWENGCTHAFYYGNFKQTGKYDWCEGIQPQIMFYGYNYTDTGCVYDKNIAKVLTGTDFQDSRLDLFVKKVCRFDVNDYMALYKRQPEVRFLIDNELGFFIDENMNSRHYQNQSFSKEFFQVLYSHKEFFPLFRDIKIRQQELILVNAFKSRKFIKKDIILQIRSLGIADEIIPAFQYTNPLKAVNYLKKRLQEMPERKPKEVLIQWLDYLRFAEFMDYDMTSSFILFPRMLTQKHDELMDEYNAAGFTDNKRIALMEDKLNAKYYYEDETFLIRAPKSAKEIKDEGSALRHCVSSYVRSIAKLGTFVFFIRTKEEPDKPLYTLEYYNGNIRQCHGYSHKNPTDEIKNFTDKWLTHICKQAASETLKAA